MEYSRGPLVVAAAIGLLLSSGWHTGRAAGATAYAHMAPIRRYFMADRNAESALARSAAPPAISNHATVEVLGARGYEVMSKGTNGFTCIVERGWTAPFDFPEFWNPRIRGPICYNPPASRTVLLYTLKRTELVLEGLSKPQIMARIDALLAAKRLPIPEAGSMSYMMSKSQYLNDGAKQWIPHLMFHAPKSDGAADGASWGADLPRSPIMLDTSHHVMPEPETIFMIPAGRWSDGSAAPSGMEAQ